MKKLERKRTSQREAVLAFACDCKCLGACTCPPNPTHQIGVNVTSYQQNSAGDRTLMYF